MHRDSKDPLSIRFASPSPFTRYIQHPIIIFASFSSFCIQVNSDKNKIVRLYITASFFGLLCRYTLLSDGFFPLRFGESDINIYSWYSIRTFRNASGILPLLVSVGWSCALPRVH